MLNVGFVVTVFLGTAVVGLASAALCVVYCNWYYDPARRRRRREAQLLKRLRRRNGGRY